MKQKRKVKSLLPQKSYLDGKFLTILLLVLSLVLCLGSVSLVTHSVGAQGIAGGVGFQGGTIDPTLRPGVIDPGIGVVEPGNGGQGQRIEENYKVTIKYLRSVDSKELYHSENKCGRFDPRYNVSSPDVTNYELFDPEQSIVSGLCPSSQTTIEVFYKPVHDLNGNGIADEEESLQEVTEFDYTGIDNKIEVLYSMHFVDPLDLQKIVNNIYMSGSSLYITPNPVVVNPRNDLTNKVESGVYSHILGGKDNEVYSNNVTIIAGRNNKVYSGNDNVSILGGDSNEIAIGDGVSVPSVLVGGYHNIIDLSRGGNALIGGSGNIIGGAKDSFIFGGFSNLLGEVENFIVGGVRVTAVNGLSNVFVYSNSGDFSPSTSNAFYLNMMSGAGINTAGVDGLSVGGAVSFGEININEKFCDDDNLGVEGVYEGCLVGCTSASKPEGKWEMLDQGNRCAQVCNDIPSRCIYDEDIEVEVDDHSAQCVIFVPGLSTGNADPCVSNGELDSYKNVFFETSLLDYEDQCPSSVQNVCYYKCKTGYHLHENQCKQDCEFQWYNGTIERIRHGEERVGYETGSVNCSSNDGRGNKTCADYKKTLICDSGTMKIKNTDNVAQGGYYHTGCEMVGYRCDTGTYNLTLADIHAMGDTIPNNYTDRATVTGNKGVYKVCLDFGGVGQTTCSTGDAHFFFSGCKNGYTRDESTQMCKKKCGNTAHGSKIMFYKTSSATCTGVCDGQIFTCNDGVWTGSYDKSGYTYTTCSLKEKKCNGFNLTGGIYEIGSGTSYYASCTKYSTSGNTQCITGDTNYKLTGCIENHHTENMQWCIPNERPYTCTKPDNSHYVGGSGVTWYETWSGSWNTGYWISPKCNWECNEGYRKSEDGKSCVKIPDDCGEERYTCVDSGARMWDTGSNDGAYFWKCENRQCSLCKENYHPIGSGDVDPYCAENEHGKCGPVHYECISGRKEDRTEGPTQFNWDCMGIGSGTYNDLGCYECKLHATWDEDEGRCKCDDGYYEGPASCEEINFDCPEDLEHLYQCKYQHNGEWVSATQTGYDDNGDYFWMCGDRECRLPKDNSSSNNPIKVCRDVEYDTCGNNSSPAIKKVSFRSEGNFSFWVTQPLVIKIIHTIDYNGVNNIYDSYNCIQKCSNGYCENPECEGTTPLTDTNEQGVVSICNKLNGYNYSWGQYIDSLGTVQYSPEMVEYVGDCPSEPPKCGISAGSCTVGSPSGFNSETNTWKCVNKMNQRVECVYKCDCPRGYVRDGDSCKIYAEFCATPASSDQVNYDLTCGGNVVLGWQQGEAISCCGKIINPNAGPSSWPHQLSKFPCAANDRIFWADNIYAFYLNPLDESTDICPSSLTWDDILRTCELHPYGGYSDNGYYIDDSSCTLYNGSLLGGCNCRVSSV